MADQQKIDPVAHLAAIVQFSDDAIISKQLDGTISTWNRGAERLFGYSAAEAIGRSIRMIIPDDRWHEEDDVLRAVCRGEVVDHFETERQRRDGSRVVISLTVSPIKDASGRIVGASKIARDISSRREAELERTHLLAEAQAAGHAKDQFLAVLSHELRTPLNAILGWSEVLRRQSTDPAILARGIEAISRNVRAQATLIDELLDISRIVSGKLGIEVRPIELAPVVETALEGIRPVAAVKGLRLESALEADALVLGDAARLQQVVWNLLSNAVKFTPAGGEVKVLLATVEGRVELSVQDSGIGIPPDYLAFVFDRFSQADSSIRRQAGGMGLGLAIARELVQLHGGGIAARSAGPGQGAEFVVTLPHFAAVTAPTGIVAEHLGSASPASIPLPDLGGLRVLVVDDDAASREVTEAILRSLGAEVRLAASAAEARAALAAARPDVLVADVGMPVEDGYSLMRSLTARQASGGDTIPAIALTALAGPEDRQQALAAGFCHHLAKPVESHALALAVARLAGPARRRGAA